MRLYCHLSPLHKYVDITTQNYNTALIFAKFSVLNMPTLQICSQIKHVRIKFGQRGGVVIKILRYKPTGRGFGSQWFHWNFSVTQSFRSHYCPGVDSTSNRNDNQVYFLGVKAAVE
jgi:hypothetical protein